MFVFISTFLESICSTILFRWICVTVVFSLCRVFNRRKNKLLNAQATIQTYIKYRFLIHCVGKTLNDFKYLAYFFRSPYCHLLTFMSNKHEHCNTNADVLWFVLNFFREIFSLSFLLYALATNTHNFTINCCCFFIKKKMYFNEKIKFFVRF